MVHNSRVDIAHMRIGIESVRFQVVRSCNAVLESNELLARLRQEGWWGQQHRIYRQSPCFMPLPPDNSTCIHVM